MKAPSAAFHRAPPTNAGLVLLALLATCTSSTPDPPPASATDASSNTGGGADASSSHGGADAAPTNAGVLAYKPCDPAKRVGGFAVQLMEAMQGSPPYTQVDGSVTDGVNPRDVWQEVAKEGACRLIVGRKLLCTQECADQMICAGDDKCVPAPVPLDVGTVAITGLAAPVSLKPGTTVIYYGSLPSTAAYPPFAAEAEVTLQATGAKVAAFSLAGRGITPVEFDTKGLLVSRGKAVTVTWKAPAKGGSQRIVVGLDIAHHGGIAARIACDVEDSGSMTIPAALIGQLMDRGVAGFPALTLVRRTVDSTTTSLGCVDFAVASSVEREVAVEGIVSCNSEKPCPDGKPCRTDSTCRP